MDLDVHIGGRIELQLDSTTITNPQPGLVGRLASFFVFERESVGGGRECRG